MATFCILEPALTQPEGVSRLLHCIFKKFTLLFLR